MCVNPCLGRGATLAEHPHRAFGRAPREQTAWPEKPRTLAERHTARIPHTALGYPYPLHRPSRSTHWFVVIKYSSFGMYGWAHWRPGGGGALGSADVHMSHRASFHDVTAPESVFLRMGPVLRSRSTDRGKLSILLMIRTEPRCIDDGRPRGVDS